VIGETIVNRIGRPCRELRVALVASLALGVSLALIATAARADPSFVSEVGFPYDIRFTPALDIANYTGSPYDAEAKLNQVLTYLYTPPSPVATCSTSAPGDNLGEHMGLYVMGNCTVTFQTGAPLQLTVWGVAHCPVGTYDAPYLNGLPSFHPG